MSNGQDFSPEKFRSLRIAMGFQTPKEFADAINARLKKDPDWKGPVDLSWRTIDRVEKGTNDPAASTLRAVSRAFGLPWIVFLQDNQ